jgi:hypothetical protein
MARSDLDIEEGKQVEEWRPVVGYEGLYSVSDLGRVRSHDRISTSGRRVHGRILTGGMDCEGYRQYSFTPKGAPGRPEKPRLIRGHVLVLTAFVGPRPEGMLACHKNDTPDDNRLVNLRWDRPLGNHADRVRLRTGLTSLRLHRPRTRVRQPHGPEFCLRRHRLVEPNLMRPQPGRPKGRCLACKRAHNTVNDAWRVKGLRLDLDAEAERHYARIMGAAA